MALLKLFRFFYTSLFLLLNFVTFVLLLVAPADVIVQALKNDQLYYVFVIAGCFFLTVVAASGIYASRLLTNRSVLRSIPKTYIPVEKGDVNKKVRKMIAGSLSRSSAIAWDSRPRIPSQPYAVRPESESRGPVARTAEPEKGEEIPHKLRKSHERGEKGGPTIVIPSPKPVWGEIAHNGWSSPTSPDLPNLQYVTVILELPHLIEARAVSLAPPDGASTSEPPLPDIRAVDLLQRPAAMGLRDYITHLINLGVITSPSTATEFLAAYEFARFSGRPLAEPQFRDLMREFAAILRNMAPLSAAILASLDINAPESDIDDDATSSSTPATQRSRSLISSGNANSRVGSEGTIRTAPSRRVETNGTPMMRREEFSTAPATPRSKKRAVSTSPGANSFAQSRRSHYRGSGTSSDSLRSTSQFSVVKLSRTNKEGEPPYALNIPRAR